MNTITIIGNIGQDLVPKFTASGQKVTSFSVATRSKKGGEEITTWWRVNVWGDRFDKMMVHLKKGSYIVVVGELANPTIWTDKQGQSKVQLEITANSLHFMPGNKTNAPESKTIPLPSSQPSVFGDAKHTEVEDELPF